MKKVILTSGPRGAGKSTVVKTVLEKHPEIKHISRDEILIEMFGSVSLNPYTGGHEIADIVIKERLTELFQKEKEFVLIFDYFNWTARMRKNLIEFLRDLGADSVVCWQFTTPLETCLEWFFTKDDSKGYSKDGQIHDYKLYHSSSEEIETEGFDFVYKVNPSVEFSIEKLLA